MILGNIAIQDALDNGSLVIDPEPTPRQPQNGGPDCPYNETGVDLTLGNQLSIPVVSPFAFDLRRGSLKDFLDKNHRKYAIDPDGGFTLGPNQFVIGNTREVIKLPVHKDKICLTAQIQGRSSLARCGLLVHLTAPSVHAGFIGTLTLEMINLGIHSIVLFPGMSIAQLIIHQVEGKVFTNPSQFQEQNTPSGIRLE